MKPAHIKEKRKKHFRRINKRLNQIYEEQKALGYRKLEEPIRHGWFKETVLTAKVERYKNHKELLEIYDKCVIQIWGADKGKADKEWERKERHHWFYRGFKLMSPRSFHRLPIHLKKQFKIYYYLNCRKKWKHKYYPVFPKDTFRVKYSKAYVTHTKIIDPELESEEALLDAFREKKGYYELYEAWWNYDDKWIHRMEHKSKKRKSKQELFQYKGMQVKDALEMELLWQN